MVGAVGIAQALQATSGTQAKGTARPNGPATGAVGTRKQIVAHVDRNADRLRGPSYQIKAIDWV